MDATRELKGILTSLRDSWRRGQTRRVLAGLDDQRLKDIGLLERAGTAGFSRPRADPALARQPPLMVPVPAAGIAPWRAASPTVTMLQACPT